MIFLKELMKPEKRIRIVNFTTAALMFIFIALMFVKDYSFVNPETGKTVRMSLIQYLMFPLEYDPSNAVYTGIPFKTYLEDTLTKYSGMVGTSDWINTVVRVPAWMFFSGLIGGVLCIIFNKKNGGAYILPVFWCLFGLIGYPFSEYLKLGGLYWVRYAYVIVVSVLVFGNIVLCIKEAKAKKKEIKRLDDERAERWARERAERETAKES